MGYETGLKMQVQHGGLILWGRGCRDINPKQCNWYKVMNFRNQVVGRPGLLMLT